MSSGFLLINKPSGPTSHDIIDELRQITGERRIGHAGTLDPFASGLLIVAVRREATRQISQFSKMDKTYIAKIHLGAISDTYDRTGLIIQNVVRPHNILSSAKTEITHMQNVTRSRHILHRTKIKKILKKFIGEQMQIPPMYSAKKIRGKKLYELARKGMEIERQPAKIFIHYIKLLSFNLPTIRPNGRIVGKNTFGKFIENNKENNKNDKIIGKGMAGKRCNGSLKRCDDAHLMIETRVSSGTYIRSLAHDIGQTLGCGAYLEKLQRTAIGDYKLENAVETKNLTKENWSVYLIDK